MWFTLGFVALVAFLIGFFVGIVCLAAWAKCLQQKEDKLDLACEQLDAQVIELKNLANKSKNEYIESKQRLHESFRAILVVLSEKYPDIREVTADIVDTLPENLKTHLCKEHL